MLSKKTIFFIVINLIMALLMYAIYRIKFSPTGIKEDFISVGSNLITDNNNIWVVNTNDSQLVEVDYNGKKIKQFTTGFQPKSAISFGAYIWVANYGDSTISEILVTDGTSNSIPTGKGPWCCAYDGNNIWVTSYDGYCVVFNSTTNQVAKKFYIGAFPKCCLFDGSNIWITLEYTGNVLLIDIGDFSIKDTFKVGDNPTRMTFSNDYLYVLNSNSISKLNSQGVQATFNLPSDDYTDIVSDSNYIWIASSSGNIACYNIKDGAFVSGMNTGTNANSILLLTDSIVALDNTNNILTLFKKSDNSLISTLNL